MLLAVGARNLDGLGAGHLNVLTLIHDNGNRRFCVLFNDRGSVSIYFCYAAENTLTCVVLQRLPINETMIGELAAGSQPILQVNRRGMSSSVLDRSERDKILTAIVVEEFEHDAAKFRILHGLNLVS